MIFVLMGYSSNGKDTILNILKKQYFLNTCVSHTTRPPRKDTNEQDGIDYYFISETNYFNMLKNKEFIETRKYKTKYGTWYYGLSKSEIDLSKNQMVILDAQGFRALQKEIGNENVVGIYITVDEDVRINRAFKREPNKINTDKEYKKEIYRRALDDFEVFNDVENDDKVYKVDNTYNIKYAIEKVYEIFLENKTIN
ncbi:guanylate kinase [Clostridium sp.]|uniref:guanylate kinase n=1 Tax=Clostridium sp. TaxID=1506 RepID=UPI0026281624|nr:guanylate kinase [Clostridium sp.]